MTPANAVDPLLHDLLRRHGLPVLLLDAAISACDALPARRRQPSPLDPARGTGQPAPLPRFLPGEPP